MSVWLSDDLTSACSHDATNAVHACCFRVPRSCHLADEIAALALLVRSELNVAKLSTDSFTTNYANRTAGYV
jgi:hypothetical protein